MIVPDCFILVKKLGAKFYHKHHVGEQQSAQTVVPEE